MRVYLTLSCILPNVFKLNRFNIQQGLLDFESVIIIIKKMQETRVSEVIGGWSIEYEVYELDSSKLRKLQQA